MKMIKSFEKGETVALRAEVVEAWTKNGVAYCLLTIPGFNNNAALSHEFTPDNMIDLGEEDIREIKKEDENGKHTV